MFLYQPELSSEDRELLEDVKKKLGVMPPHFEFLLSVNPKRFRMFIQEITYLATHPNINLDLFAMLRLHIANKEEFTYCKSFNTKLLLAKGYDKKDIKTIKEDISNIPLDHKHQLLAKKAILSVYNPELFGMEDINELKELSWSDADIFDAVDHACFLFKNAKIIKAYTK